VHYRFDAAGNLVERRDERQLDGEEPKTLALAWDANQRLVRSRRRSTFGNGKPDEAETVYGYDPMGRRVFKRTGGDETRFGWDGDALLAERSSDEKPDTTGRREYLYYPHSLVPLAVVDGEVSYRYYNDPNGSPIRLTRGDGRVVWAARQEAWGAARVQVHELANPIRLQGQYADRETGLHYNRHRHFDPLAGQFVSQDPLGMGAGPHPYQYAANALTWVDPLGLMARRPRYEPVYRQLSAQDRERFDQGLGLTPKGTGGSIAEHVQGIDTQYISASKTAEATKRYASGNGLVKIDVQKVIDGGCNFVDHNNVLNAVERSGDKTAVKNAKLALEVLLKGGVPFEAMELVSGGTCRR